MRVKSRIESISELIGVIRQTIGLRFILSFSFHSFLLLLFLSGVVHNRSAEMRMSTGWGTSTTADGITYPGHRKIRIPHSFMILYELIFTLKKNY